MKFLGGLGLFLLGIIIIVAAFRSKRPVRMGGHASCLVVAFVVIGAGTMLTEAWNWGKFFFSLDNLTNWEPTPTYQVAATWDPHSVYAPTSVVRPTQAIAYRPVTWMELVSFLEVDPTNRGNRYDPILYDCLDFAVDLVENAGKQNIKAWIVAVMFYNQELGHAFTAFETTDLGVVYIEPQKDFRYMNPMIGKPLCDASTGTMCQGIISSIEYCDHSLNCTPYFP